MTLLFGAVTFFSIMVFIHLVVGTIFFAFPKLYIIHRRLQIEAPFFPVVVVNGLVLILSKIPVAIISTKLGFNPAIEKYYFSDSVWLYIFLSFLLEYCIVVSLEYPFYRYWIIRNREISSRKLLAACIIANGFCYVIVLIVNILVLSTDAGG